MAALNINAYDESPLDRFMLSWEQDRFHFIHENCDFEKKIKSHFAMKLQDPILTPFIDLIYVFDGTQCSITSQHEFLHKKYVFFSLYNYLLIIVKVHHSPSKSHLGTLCN